MEKIFSRRNRAFIRSSAYEKQRMKLLRRLNEHAFTGHDNAQIKAQELARNTLRKYRNRRNIERSIWASRSTFPSRLGLMTAVYFKS